MVRISKTEHYFATTPQMKKKEYKIVDTIFGTPITLKTSAAIFSPREIDYGALMLMKFMVLRKNTDILDLGCGYGVIGIIAAKFCPSSSVTMVDIDERSISCAKDNIILNNVPNATAKQSFIFSSLKDKMFDTILINPPLSEGLDICYKMIEKSFEHLKEKGSVQIVSKNKKDEKEISEKMLEVFGNVDLLGKSRGTFVYISEKRTPKSESLKE